MKKLYLYFRKNLCNVCKKPLYDGGCLNCDRGLSVKNILTNQSKKK